MKKYKADSVKVYVRRLRHWKQRFNKNAEFIWQKPVIWGNVKMTPGDKIPEDLAASPTKLRRFWESQAISLMEFEAPNVATGVKKALLDFDLPDNMSVVQGKATWFIVTLDGKEEKVNGLRALKKFAADVFAKNEVAQDVKEEISSEDTFSEFKF